MGDPCPSCQQEFSRLGLHWGRSDCPYPFPSPVEDMIFTGLLMGDASLATHDSPNPYLRWNNTNFQFMNHVHNKLSPLTTGVTVHRTAEESASYNQLRTDRDWPVNPDLYNTIYLTRTRRIPYFNKYKQWYTKTGKRFPTDLKLTPTIAKYWYVCDGTVNWMRKYSSKIQFTSRNEQDREQYIVDLFSKVGFRPKRNRHMYYFSTEESVDVLRWMGDPLPGFEYKWELSSRTKYRRLKEDAYNQ